MSLEQAILRPGLCMFDFDGNGCTRRLDFVHAPSVSFPQCMIYVHDADL